MHLDILIRCHLLCESDRPKLTQHLSAHVDKIRELVEMLEL